jgi:uncharacterized repeat protein (TIGR03803 family)
MTFGGNTGTSGYPYGNGTLFKLQPDGSFTELHVFTWDDGSYMGEDYTSSPTLNMPQIVVAPDGTMYGCTLTGGVGGYGTLFRLTTDGTFTKLHEFIADGVDGWLPDTGLVWGPDGALYGTTVWGGTDGNGTVFRLDTNGNYTVLHSFSYDDGGLYNLNWDGSYYYDASLVVGPDGALYGVTTSGGNGNGTIFKLRTDGTFTKLYDFTDASCSRPALVVGADGALYGSSSARPFKVTTDGYFTYLNGTMNWGSIMPSMVLGPDGALYGCGVENGFGIFRLQTNGTVTLLHKLMDGYPLPAPLVVGPDGALYGSTLQGEFFRMETNGNYTTLWDSMVDGGGTSGAVAGALVLGPDGAFYGCGGNANSICKLVLPFTQPLVQALNPSQTTAGSGDVSVTINGVGFFNGARAFFDNTEVAVTYLGTTRLMAVVPAGALPSPVDFSTMQVTVLNPGGGLSKPAAFTVIASGVSGSVSQVQSSVAPAGGTATVQAAPSDPTAAGVAASLQNIGGAAPATVTAASYTENPTPAPAFQAGGGFVDLKVSGVSPSAQLSSLFYYPQSITGADEAALTLKFYNGSQWITVLSSGGVTPVKNTTDNLDATISGGRFTVVFDNTSTPPITALNGTVFAVAVPDTTPPTVSCPNLTIPANVNLLVPVTYPAPTVSDNIDPAPKVTFSIPSGAGFPIGTTTVICTATDAAGNPATTTFTVTRVPLAFSGFLSPIGAADATGGSYGAPVRTFKAGSTIPVKFTAQCGGTAVTSGIHRL